MGHLQSDNAQWILHFVGSLVIYFTGDVKPKKEEKY
jgi:hypothetical protein